jgi:hypothetical protein
MRQLDGGSNYDPRASMREIHETAFDLIAVQRDPGRLMAPSARFSFQSEAPLRLHVDGLTSAGKWFMRPNGVI